MLFTQTFLSVWLTLAPAFAQSRTPPPSPVVSPRMLEVAARVRRHIAEKRPGWSRRGVQPMAPGREVTVDHWRFGASLVRVSLVMNESPARAASSLASFRYHTELEEQVAESQGRSNHPAVKEELPALGTEGLLEETPFHFVTAFRKGLFSCYVAVEKSGPGDPAALSKEFARLAADALPAADGDYGRTGLPPYGSHVPDPKRENVVYYLAVLPDGLKPKGAADTGLYVSRDGGRAWELLTGDYKFKQLFIHPDNGKLFAVAEYYWPPDGHAGGGAGRRAADRVITSEDGRNWRDITGKAGRLREGVHIFADPEHSGRICLTVHDAIRGYQFCAADDDHSGWEPTLPW